jgi:HTH-type transcriptional regulator / antitoxin HigA
MERIAMNAQFRKLAEHFAAVQQQVPLHPIRTHEEYDAAVAAMNKLLDTAAADEQHPLADLVATLGALIGDYDDQHCPRPDVSGADMLKFLMEQHGLKQGDLPEIGTQGVVSEIINGKREINLRHVKQLKQRFGISADAFA